MEGSGRDRSGGGLRISVRLQQLLHGGVGSVASQVPCGRLESQWDICQNITTTQRFTLTHSDHARLQETFDRREDVGVYFEACRHTSFATNL